MDLKKERRKELIEIIDTMTDEFCEKLRKKIDLKFTIKVYVPELSKEPFGRRRFTINGKDGCWPLL